VHYEHLPIHNAAEGEPREHFCEKTHGRSLIVVLTIHLFFEPVEFVAQPALVVAASEVNEAAGAAAELERNKREHNLHAELPPINKIPIEYIMVACGWHSLDFEDTQHIVKLAVSITTYIQPGLGGRVAILARASTTPKRHIHVHDVVFLHKHHLCRTKESCYVRCVQELLLFLVFHQRTHPIQGQMLLDDTAIARLVVMVRILRRLLAQWREPWATVRVGYRGIQFCQATRNQ
jgi:hypothetical protein